MQVRVGWVDRLFLQGVTTRTDGPPVLFPPTVCKACGEENASRTNLHDHDYEEA